MRNIRSLHCSYRKLALSSLYLWGKGPQIAISYCFLIDLVLFLHVFCILIILLIQKLPWKESSIL